MAYSYCAFGWRREFVFCPWFSQGVSGYPAVGNTDWLKVPLDAPINAKVCFSAWACAARRICRTRHANRTRFRPEPQDTFRVSSS